MSSADRETIFVPDKCPDCGHVFSKYLGPKKKMQKKAIVLFLIGVCSIFPWTLLIFFLVSLLPVIPIPRNGAAAAAVIFVLVVLVLAPGVAIGAVAMAMRKIITFRCRKCGWKETHVL